MTKFVSILTLAQRTTNPTGINAGDMYFNTTSNEVRVYSGTAWIAVGTGAVGGNEIYDYTTLDGGNEVSRIQLAEVIGGRISETADGGGV